MDVMERTIGVSEHGEKKQEVMCILFCLGNKDDKDLHVLTHSFPTRRSSDLLLIIILLKLL